MAGGVTGLATPVPTTFLNGSDEVPIAEARVHHELLAAYAARSAVRPVRFGSVFSSEAALGDALHVNEEDHLSWLHHMAERVEYALKVIVDIDSLKYDKHSAEHLDSGRSFLERKRAARDDRRTLSTRRAAFAESLPGRVAAVTAGIVPLRTATPQVLASHALLVDRKAKALMDLAQVLGRDAGDLGLKLALNGPGPCYAFAELTDAMNSCSATNREAVHA